MISKNDIKKLYLWGIKTNFPLRNEVITSRYMGYGLKICHLKIGKKRKLYPNKKLTDEVFDIIGSDEILGAYYLVYPPKMTAKPHIDYNPYKQKYLRIQIPIKLSEGDCYIEWIDTGGKIYWEKGKAELFNVEKAHQGANDGSERMEFLYIDVKHNTKVEI